MPPKKVSSDGGAASSEGQTVGVETMKDTYIPIFNNSPGDYKEWRSRINLYRRKLDLQGKSKEAVINLLTSLSGVSWKQVEHNVESFIEDKDGFDKVLAVLDKAFKYDDRVEMPRALEKFFYTMGRRGDQTLMAYCADHREALRQLEKHGITIPDNVVGWLLLRRSGLTLEQKQLIQSREPSLAADKIEENMYFLLGQDYKGRAGDDRKWVKGRDRHAHRGHLWRPRTSYGYAAEELYEADDFEEPDDAYFDDEAYIQEDDDPSSYGADSWEEVSMAEEEAHYAGQDGDEGEQDPDLEEAYATYLDARRQFANLRAARGFYPIVALGPDATTSSSGSQYPRPPSSGGGSKGKSKSKGRAGGKGKGRGYAGPAGSKGHGTIKHRGQSAMSPPPCFLCGRPGHTPSQCPNSQQARSSPTSSTSPSKRSKTDQSANMVADTSYHAEDGKPALGPDGWFGIQDGGASSMVCGHETLMNIIDYMSDHGLKTSRYQFMATDKTFAFGGDARRSAEWSVRLPVYIKGQHGFIECFVVNGATPLLIGRPILAALEVKTDYAQSKVSVLGSAWEDAVFGARGEYLLRLDEGVDTDPNGDHIFFDYVTDETHGCLHHAYDPVDYVTLEDYLVATGRRAPERAYYNNVEGAGCPPRAEPAVDIPARSKDITREITPKLLKSIHHHYDFMENQRAKTIENIMEAHEKGIPLMWEVYSGDALLACTFKKRGWRVMTFDLLNGWDFEKTKTRREFLELLDKVCPEFIWLAPPCKKWSTLQNLNLHTLAQIEALEAERDFQEATHLTMCKKAFVKQWREGRDAALEQPRYAVSWKTKTLDELPGWRSNCDMCQFGAMLPDDEAMMQYIKKPTSLLWTNEMAAAQMSMECDDDHYHLPIEGSSPGIGNRARASGRYQEGFCEAVVNTVVHIYNDP